MDLHVSLLQREHHEILAEIAIWQILAYIVFLLKSALNKLFCLLILIHFISVLIK